MAVTSRAYGTELRIGIAPARLALPVVLFMIGLVIPMIFMIGGLRLSAYGIVLLIMIIPLLFSWLSGGCGRIRVADMALLLLCAWTALSLMVVHGPATAIETGGSFFYETMGAYLLARCYIRNADEFYRMVRILFLIIVVLMPFAVVETFTGQNLPVIAFNSIGTTDGVRAMDPRWGLTRAQSVLEHPILFGVFCGSALALTYMVLGRGRPLAARLFRTSLVFFTGCLSLSSGPLTGMVAQILLIGWNATFFWIKARWQILAAMVAAAYIFVEIAATRSPLAIFSSYFAFSKSTGYNRIFIWRYVSRSILDHPFLGVGLNEWERPDWMRVSVDMFWVVFGLRHGIPALVLTFLAFFAVFLPLAFRKGLDARQSDYRLGILFCLTSFFLTGWAVHFWNATYALFIFLLGSGVWLLDARPDPAAEIAVSEQSRARARRRAPGDAIPPPAGQTEAAERASRPRPKAVDRPRAAKLSAEDRPGRGVQAGVPGKPPRPGGA